ncbi:MAG: hypothetical protein GY841_15395 [FCB group bacterium]|nr:hypothetical protein [FCB group bacterium]
MPDTPKNFMMQPKWVLYIDGMERIRFSRVTVPDETVSDNVIRQGAQTHPDRAPGEYQPVDVEVEGPAYFSDPTFRTMWNRTIDVINGGGAIGEDLYFDCDLVQLDRDNETEMEKYRLHRCYCGGRKFGDFDAEADGARKKGLILRPKKIEEKPVA